MNKFFPILLGGFFINIKNITLLFVLIVLFQSCAIFTSYGRNYTLALNHYNNKQYDLAVVYLIKSLDSKSDYQKSLDLYEKAVPEAINNYHNNINQYTAEPDFEDELVREYKALFKLIEAIENAKISDIHVLYLLSSYEEDYNLALQNAAESHYQRAQYLMSLDNKRKYKEAIGALDYANTYIENYKNSKYLIEECKNKAIFSIAIMDFENNMDSRYNNVGAIVSNKILSGLSNNSPFKEFVNIIDREKIETVLEELKMSASGLIHEEGSEKLGFIKGIDHIITGDINQIIINKPKHTRQIQSVEHRVQIGSETFFNEDSLEVTTPIFGTEFKEITIHQLNASSSIEVFLKIIDISTSDILMSDTFYSKKTYYDEWATGLDDINPTAQYFKDLKNKKSSKNVLNSEELFQKAINENNSKILKSIIKFYE